ncbi:hypothetical protein MTO96_026813 [Rhipicephalus appendiculatus]
MAKQRSTFEIRPLVQAAIRPSRSGSLGLEATPLQHLKQQADQQTLDGSQSDGLFTNKFCRIEPRADSVYALDNHVNTIVVGLVEHRSVPSQ